MTPLLAFGLLALAPVQGNQTGNSIWDRLKFEADGRMRAEATLENVDPATGNDVEDRYRGRFRFRFGAKYTLEEDFLVGARLSTASDQVTDAAGNTLSDTDANNPHWDFGDGDGFSGGGVVMDRYYIDWTASKETHVVFGKQQHAFAVPPIFSDFLWDSDISPAGVTATWKPASAEGPSFDARAAAYYAGENSGDHDPKMIGAQGNVYIPIDDVKVHVSTAVYDWTNIGDISAAVAGSNQGNNDTEFFVWEIFGAATMPGGPLDEMTGFVQLFNNLDEGDNGVVLGGQLGSSKWERGNYNAFLLLYDFDGNATYSPVAQDDTPVAGTGLNDGDADGMNGIVVGGQYFWRDHVALKLWVLTSNAAGADDDPIRIRLDVDFKVK